MVPLSGSRNDITSSHLDAYSFRRRIVFANLLITYIVLQVAPMAAEKSLTSLEATLRQDSAAASGMSSFRTSRCSLTSKTSSARTSAPAKVKKIRKMYYCAVLLRRRKTYYIDDQQQQLCLFSITHSQNKFWSCC